MSFVQLWTSVWPPFVLRGTNSMQVRNNYSVLASEHPVNGDPQQIMINPHLKCLLRIQLERYCLSLIFSRSFNNFSNICQQALPARLKVFSCLPLRYCNASLKKTLDGIPVFEECSKGDQNFRKVALQDGEERYRTLNMRPGKERVQIKPYLWKCNFEF